MQEPTVSSRLAVREYPKDLTPLINQKWLDLAFLHWEFDPDEVQRALPKGLFVDTFESKAYVAITPFSLKDIKFSFFSFLPSMADSLEINLRTYVYDEFGTPGVWFFSLDINSKIIAEAAKGFFSLPYHYADIEFDKNKENQIIFKSLREGKTKPLEIDYQGSVETFEAQPGTLEFFLIERYVLFVEREKGEIEKGRIHHKPYLLSKAEVSKWDDALFEFEGLKRPSRKPDHILYSPGVDVEIFGLQPIKND